MKPSTIALLERIAALNVRILPLAQLPNHIVFERDGCVVLVERRGEELGGLGSPGLLTDRGFAALVDSGGQNRFVWKGGSRPAEPHECAAARRLFTDLREILG